MAFPESVKNEALKKAHFMCVACHEPFVEVHHILPHGEGGPDTLDNAAPLCSGCHGIYGANPVYRKQIRQMRDNWYDVCEKKFGSSNLNIAQELNTLAVTLKDVRSDQVQYQKTLDHIKTNILTSLAGTASVIKSSKSLEEIATATSSAIYTVSSKSHCLKCGTPFLPYEPIPENCYRCGEPTRID